MMLRSVKDLRGYRVRATDEDIGKVHDFYFDDEEWNIRYLVIDTGEWFSDQKVLISPVALGKPDWEENVFPVSLTKEQIEKSPSIDTDKPISYQQESELRKYYESDIYWSNEEVKGDLHLRSTNEVIDYQIQATDGEIGKVEDFIVEDEDWIIRYMGVDTGSWLPGKKVIVPPQWIEKIDWHESKIYVELNQESVKNSPEYDPSESVYREYEERLYDHYGREKYWL